MTEQIAEATVRLSISGDAGRVDLAAPLWSRLSVVAERFASQTGSPPVTLSTPTGKPLDATTTVHAARLNHGDLLIATAVHPSRTSLGRQPADGSGRRSGARRRESDPANPALTLASGLARKSAPGVVAVLGVLATIAARFGADTALTAASIGLIVMISVAVAMVFVLDRSDRVVEAGTWLPTLPLLAAATATLIVPSDRAGSTLLSATAAALVFSAAAFALRAAVPEVADGDLLVEGITGGLVALVGAVTLLAGWSPLTFASLVLVTAVLIMRSLPSFVIDVPDNVLVDIDRLAVTAWTAREQPRPSFRGVIREGDIRSLAREAQGFIASASVVCSLIVGTCAAWLLLAEKSGPRHIGIMLLCVSAGASLTLGGRSLRSQVARGWQRTTGTLLLCGFGVSLLLTLADRPRGFVTAGLIILGLVIALVARAVGRGFTSVWWSRVAELCEGFSAVVLVGAVPLVTGLYDWMRQLTS